MNRKEYYQPKISGIPCPNCKELIPISMKQLIMQSALVCPICGYRMELDKKKSSKTLERLKELHENIK